MTSPSFALTRQNLAQPVPTLWDVANIFEYATSRFAAIRESLDKSQVSRTPHYQERFVQHLVWEADRFVFPFINMYAINNTQPCLSEYLKQVVKMLTSWQMGALDNPSLFHKFSTHQFDTSGDLMVRYRNLWIHQYTWWKDRFDLMPFEVPNRLTMHEVIQLYRTHMQQTPAAHILLPEIRRRAVGPDPLLNNLRVIRDDLEDLGTKLKDWLTEKIKDGSTALEEMT
ncbi:hypothetical protein DFJ58DRAFT_733253 [Suillus subalutaceus]|uniref:uncharacterized protein n=1 Tax=Suillus subalutaceus TaxID=48586 RepID=UPI001B85C68A|nr:uncharacterized protein DFJ58DRAFT_733253 [Suillus subalutaceus]KAG1839663.1 hypothetical protein DFJ58DRAFT_733253 [Suillus subalutaceus]